MQQQPPIEQQIEELVNCPAGMAGWHSFESLSTAILSYLFVPPLHAPRIQERTVLGTYRRDAIFPNRNITGDTPWHLLFHDLEARAILVEYKNYDATDIDVSEMDQVQLYMRTEMGRLALMVCNKRPVDAVYTHQRTLFNRNGQVILILLRDHLIEMVQRKQMGFEPADLILDLHEDLMLRQD